MAEVDPCSNEYCKVRSNEWMVKVVERFRGLGRVSQKLKIRGRTLTARKKSLISCVMNTAIPIYVK